MSGFTNYGAGEIMAGTALPSPLYVKLHLGAAGADGVDNPATETTRQAVTFTDGATTTQKISAAEVEWTGTPATETVTHFSLWDAATDGNPWMVGEFTLPISLVPAGNASVDAGNIVLDGALMVAGS